MQNAFSPLVSMYQTQLEASRRFADAIFSGTEKIDRIMIGATHRVFTQQLKFAHALASATDPRSAGNVLQSNLLSGSPDNAMNYQKEIMRIVAEVQNDLGRSLQEYVEQIGTQAASSATAPLQSAQEHANDAVFNPVTSMFSVWESAFKEVAALAKKNMMKAESTAESVATSTMERATDYAATAAGAAVPAVPDGGGAQPGKSSSVIITEDNVAEEKRGASSPGGSKRK